ncbi:OmpA family protein [Sorangium sp. So ce1024]|uniref:OmpA family protein n=1 Tax=Sorangium sp. So ce1024 TaxID=3133327 RepID=UPI003F0CF76A
MRLSLGTALLLATLFLPVPAAAQSSTSIALDQFDPAPAGDPFFGVPSPFVGGHLIPRAHASLTHADTPLTLAHGGEEREVVGSQTLLHMGVALSLWDRLLVAAMLPLAVAQAGDGAAVPGEPAPANAPAPGVPESPAVGDLRVSARIRAFGEENSPVQIGASFGLHLPTGATDAYMGEGSVRVTPQLVVGGRVEGLLVWSAAAGATFRSSGNPSTVTYGGGAALLLWDERLQVGPEIYAATPIQGGSVGLTDRTRVEHARTTRAEVLLGARVRPLAGTALGGLAVGAAGGPGLGEGLGTPAFRLVGMLAWTPPAGGEHIGMADTDKDGLLDREDACPYAAGPRSTDAKRNGCPVADRDEDGVPDPDDACPERAGEAGTGGARRGCPLDTDGDGLEDTLDFCPTEPGSADNKDKKPGCPAPPPPPPPPPVTDADGDGILDPEDACPREKGPTSEDAAARGCPKRVRVQGEEVVLLEAIGWKGVQALQPGLDPRSVPVLEEMAAVIQDHPEWVTIEVQAHTDSTGDARFNQMISDARAEAVRKWLVEKGIAAERLVAKGYGASKPIADNAKAEGRAKNRRVQLLVLEKK